MINTEPNSCESLNSKAIKKIKEFVEDQSVVYIATTYLDYLRIQQELSLLKKYAKNVHIIVSNRKSYFLRIVYVYFRSLFFFQKTDIIFIGFAPQLVLPFLKWRFTRKKVITDFFISLYDTLVMDRKKFLQGSLISKILAFFDKITLKWSDLVISDTRTHASYFVSEFGCVKEKVVTLYLQADRKYYYPKQIEKPSELKNKFIVLYFGSVLPLQGTEVIIEAINQCENDNIFFIMIGPLDKGACFKKNVKFINWLSQPKLSDYIAMSDLCLAGHFNAEIKKASRTIPGKAYICEAMNKHIILGENEANRERYPVCYSNVDFVEMGSASILMSIIELKYKEWLNEF